MYRMSFIILLIIGLIACAEEKTANSEKTEPQEREWSELALLMREIHADAKILRQEVIDGSIADSSISVYDKLVNSTPTKAEVKGPVFEAMAKNYQQVLDSLLAAKDLQVSVQRYNILVESCVDCHNAYCPGPIPTIKKLRIKEVSEN